MKSQNIILFLLTCLCCAGLVYFEKIDFKERVSLEVLDLFPQNKDRELIDIYKKIGDSNTILVAQDAQVSSASFESFLSKVKSLPNIKEIITSNTPNKALQDFIERNYFFLGQLTPSNLSSKEMEQKILKDLSQNTFNPIDPLGLIQIPNLQSPPNINGYPLALIKLESSEASEVSALYEQFAPLAQSFGITHYFSSLFVDVINPQLILDEVNLLGGIALVFFTLLYFLILRKPFLTLNCILTIFTSNLIAIFALLHIYPKVSIMSLSFGIGISNICIDYMMHHYFLEYYLSKRFRHNLAVFYGFITTIIGFFICLFVPFPLLNQLSLYAIINLSVAYVCFAFVYQKIGFSYPKYYKILTKHFPLIPSWIFLILAFGFGGYSLTHIQRDLDLSKLDYQSKEFEAQKEFFASLQSKQVFLIQAPNINTLITKAKSIAKISKDSVGILSLLPTPQEIKKRERYFKSFAFANEKKKLKDAIYRIQRINPELAEVLKNTYRSIPKTITPITSADLKSFGVEFLKEGQYFYYQGSIDNVSKISHIQGVEIQQPKTLMKDIANSIYAPMTSILMLAFVAIIILLVVISKKQIIDSISFILLPISCILLYLSLMNIPINIMHLFAMLLVVVVGVDYGIYHIEEVPLETKTLSSAQHLQLIKHIFKAKHAMLFSILTTLCSFGLFLFSKTKALSSFGEVISIGMLCILILIFFQKDLVRK